MSHTDARAMLRIALYGAVAAVLLDYFLRPAIVNGR